MAHHPNIAVLAADAAARADWLAAAALQRGYRLLSADPQDDTLIDADLLVVRDGPDGSCALPPQIVAGRPVLHVRDGAAGLAGTAGSDTFSRFGEKVSDPFSGAFSGAVPARAAPQDVMFGSDPAELEFRIQVLLARSEDFARLQGECDNLQRLCGVLRENMLSVEQEMLFARRLQMAMIPQRIEPLKRLAIHPYFRPVGEVSGDIYGQIPLAGGRVGLFLADAVGHGIAAALLTVFVRGSLCARAAAGPAGAGELPLPDPADALRQTNRDILDAQLDGGQYVTMVYLVIDPATCRARLALGGHPAPMRIGPDGSIRPLKAAGTLLGMFEEAKFTSIDLELAPGETILLYSDGADAALAADPSQEVGALQREVAKLAGLPPVEMIDALAARMDELPGSLNPRDDVTLMAIQCVR